MRKSLACQEGKPELYCREMEKKIQHESNTTIEIDTAGHTRFQI